MKNFYILITLDRAFRLWQTSGKRCNFGLYCDTLKALGYRLLMVFLVAGLLMPSLAHGAISHESAVKAIIGEFENDNIQAGACAVYNRGSLKGVYGLHSPRVIKRLYSPKIYARAVKAWQRAKMGQGCDLLKGAGHWQSLADMKKPQAWRDKCEMTFKTDKTMFFKCGRY